VTKRQTIDFDDEAIKQVDNWRRDQTPIPSFNQAVNTMLKHASYFTAIVKANLRINSSGEVSSKYVEDAEFKMPYDAEVLARKIIKIEEAKGE